MVPTYETMALCKIVVTLVRWKEKKNQTKLFLKNTPSSGVLTYAVLYIYTYASYVRLSRRTYVYNPDWWIIIILDIVGEHHQRWHASLWRPIGPAINYIVCSPPLLLPPHPKAVLK